MTASLAPPSSAPLPGPLQGLSRAEALAWVSRLYDAQAAGAQVWSDAELCHRFLSSCSRTGSIETKNGYRRELEHLARWIAASCPGTALRSLAPHQAAAAVEDLRAEVDAGRLAPRSYNRRVAAWSALFRWASEPARTAVSGIARSPMPRRCQLVVARQPKPLAMAELDAVAAAILAAVAAGNKRAKRDYVLLRASFLIGARVSEMAQLRWQDVERLPDGDGLVHVVGKGSKARSVRVSSATMDLIEGLGRGEPDAWLFPGRNGQHLSRGAIGDRMRLWGKAAGLRLHPHRLRHSHASEAVRRGVDVFLLAASLGHSSVGTTQVYVRCNPADSSSLRLG